jgi:hypothetical protein
LQVALPFGYTTVAARRVDADWPLYVAGARGPVWTFAGLPAGTYAIETHESSEPGPGVEWGRAQVVAGRTTWVDLWRARGPYEFAGMVVGRDGPVGGARIGLHEAMELTGDDGRFALIPKIRLRPQTFLKIEHQHMRMTMTVPTEAVGSWKWSGVIQLGQHELLVRTVDARGAPCSADVFASGGDDIISRPGCRVGTRVRSDAQGRCRLFHLVAGEYSLHVRFPSGLTVERRCIVPGTSEVVVQDAEMGRITVQVVDEHGGGLRNMFVWGRLERTDASIRSHALTGANGVAELVVPAGRVRLSFDDTFIWQRPDDRYLEVAPNTHMQQRYRLVRSD